MKKLFLVFLFIFLLSGCLFSKQSTESVETPLRPAEKTAPGVSVAAPAPKNPAIKDDTTQGIKMEEVVKHDSEGDCWMIIEDKVYDVTEFVSSHPGGKAILEGCGKDGTELYQTRSMGSGTEHSDKAKSLLENYYIGEAQ